MGTYDINLFPGVTLNERAFALLCTAEKEGNGILPFYHGFPEIYGYEVIGPRKGSVHEILARFTVDGDEFLPCFDKAIMPRE
jgi:hypothetical protein